MKPNDIVYVLSEYNLTRGELLSIGPKNLKVKIFPYKGLSEHTRYIPPAKVVGETESVAVIHERWRGPNGGYRLEKTLYPNERLPANQHGYSRYVEEETKP